MWAFDIGFVRVKTHFAMAERAQGFTVFVHLIGDHQHIGPFRAHGFIGAFRCDYTFGDSPEISGEPKLVVFGNILGTEQQNRVVGPSLLDLIDCRVIEFLA